LSDPRFRAAAALPVRPSKRKLMGMRLIPKDRAVGWTPYAWLVYFIPFLVGPALGGHPTPLRWAETAVGALAFLALYFRGHWLQGRSLLWVIGGLSILGLIFMPTNPGAPALFIFASAFAGDVGETAPAVWTIVGVLVALVAGATLEGVSPVFWWWGAFFTVLVGAVNMHYAQVGRSNKKLKLAQEEVEHLAKVAERERIARDLHDLLGHTLSVIILKSELASKLSERDPERARAEIKDVERISREALSEVRNAIRGYRAGDLASELSNTREALRAAGVTVEASLGSMQLSPVQEAVLALALREATTNIVRHANAKSCVIRLDRDGEVGTLRISDDGRGGLVSEGEGLSGMRERVASLGGKVDRDGSHGTTLTITVPLTLRQHDGSSHALERGA
jgi:two-component system sensor histidine kinase DesK